MTEIHHNQLSIGDVQIDELRRGIIDLQQKADSINQMSVMFSENLQELMAQVDIKLRSKCEEVIELRNAAQYSYDDGDVHALGEWLDKSP